MDFKLLILFISLHLTISLEESQQDIPTEYEVAPWHGFKQAAITYSFDDGSRNQLLKAVPILDKYNLKATFNLITQSSNDWEGFKAAAENGHEIASHTITHSHLPEQDKETQTQEFKESKKLIEKMIGQECVTLAYPYCEPGDYDLIQKYYISARVCWGTLISHNTNDMYILSSIGIGSESDYKRAEDINALADLALKEKKWLVFLIHGIDNQAYSPFDSLELEKHIKYVLKDDNIWVATFKDISKYILEANSLIIKENKNEEGDTIIEVSTGYKTDLTKLDVPVTVARVLDDKCENVVISKENYLDEIDKQIESGRVIFDVVPGEKYIMKCL